MTYNLPHAHRLPLVGSDDGMFFVDCYSVHYVSFLFSPSPGAHLVWLPSMDVDWDFGRLSMNP